MNAVPRPAIMAAVLMTLANAAATSHAGPSAGTVAGAVADTGAHAGAGTATTVGAARISVTTEGLTEGSSTDVILIPGLASAREVWAALSARLRPSYRLHLVQIAGFAGTAAGPNASGKVAEPVAEAIVDYIVSQKLTSPVLIGHSLGGEIGLMVAARHPARIGRLIVADALPFFSLTFDPFATVERAAAPANALRQALLSASREQAEAQQTAGVQRLVKTPAARPAIVAAALASDRNTVANTTHEIMTTDLRPELGRITAPVDVIYAYDASYGVPSADIDGMYRNAYAGLAAVRLLRVDHSYHFVMLDQPEVFAETVEKILSMPIKQ